MNKYKRHLENGCIKCGSENTQEINGIHIRVFGSKGFRDNGDGVGCICEDCGHTEMKPKREALKVSLDDGKTWIDATSLRVTKEFDPMIDEDGEETEAELHFNFTHEGLVVDTWVNNVCEGSTSETYVEMGDRVVNE